MSIPREKSEVLEAMGIALLLLQTAERGIRLCMTLVLQKHSPLTLESLKQQEESERTRTIGYFLSELRKRASIAPSFDSMLEDFLKNRNDFVHDLSRVPGWGLRTSEQIETSRRFVHKFIGQTQEVIKVFSGIILAWQEQIHMSEPPLPKQEWFSEIDTIYKPLADQIFREKTSSKTR